MNKKQKRQRGAKVRKNFLPTLFAIVLLWLGLGFTVYSSDPSSMLSVLIFFAIAFLALLFTLSTLFINTRRGLVATLAVILFLLLRYFGIGNIVNLLLIVGVAISAEYYFSEKL